MSINRNAFDRMFARNNFPRGICGFIFVVIKLVMHIILCLCYAYDWK